ncbi:MAG: alpha/beta hydrolase-fold protein [Cyclobacteriaceae bacterium]|nr:alpha/beta hydrolase-fold protein [Cyclobacteriaceae bacterium]
MQNTIKPITLLLASLWFTAVFAQENNDIVIGKKYSLHSNILNEDRPYWVHLPKGYDSLNKEKKYPVLYVLDGAKNFESTVGLVQFMGNGPWGHTQIPEFIIVAVPHEDRTKDLTPVKATKGFDGEEATDDLSTSGGGPQFLNFMKDELLPHIDQSYHTEPFRVLIGHSFGGLFATWAFIKDAPFNAFIAIDPSYWWEDNFLVKMVGSEEYKGKEYTSFLYVPVAHNDLTTLDINKHRRAQEDFFVALEVNSSGTLKAKFEYFEDEDHGSVVLQATYNGLLFVFDGYKLPVPYTGKNPEQVAKYYSDYSEKLGLNVPGEPMITTIGFSYFQHKDYDKALSFFEWNIRRNPESAEAQFYMGMVYQQKKEIKKAIGYYKKAVELDPENTYFKSALSKALEDK